MKPQHLKINAGFDSSSDNLHYSMIISLSTSLISLFAQTVRLADSSLLHCPLQRTRKLCLMAVQKKTFTQPLPFEIWSCITKIIHSSFAGSLVKEITASQKCPFVFHVHVPFLSLHKVEEIINALAHWRHCNNPFLRKNHFETRVTNIT